jgi:hypothetical protein
MSAGVPSRERFAAATKAAFPTGELELRMEHFEEETDLVIQQPTGVDVRRNRHWSIG